MWTVVAMIALCSLSRGSTQTVIEDNQSKAHGGILNDEQLSWDILVLLKGQMTSTILQAEIQRTLEDRDALLQLSDAERDTLQFFQVQRYMNRLVACRRKELIAQSRRTEAVVRRSETVFEVLSAFLYTILLSGAFSCLVSMFKM